MSLQYLKDMLLEELNRKKRAKKTFEKRLNDEYFYTQIKIKTISGKDYIYVYSTKEKKDKYIGKYTKDREKELQELIDIRYKLLMELESVKSDIPVLEKMVSMI